MTISFEQVIKQTGLPIIDCIIKGHDEPMSFLIDTGADYNRIFNFVREVIPVLVFTPRADMRLVCIHRRCINVFSLTSFYVFFVVYLNFRQVENFTVRSAFRFAVISVRIGFVNSAFSVG